MPMLRAPQLQVAEQVRSVHSVTPAAGVTIEDMLEPKFWGNVADVLRPGDKIEASSEDGAWFADYYVRDVGQSWAKVVLHHKSEHGPLADDADAWQQMFYLRQVREGWHVLQVSDDTKVAVFPEEIEATNWARARCRK